MVKRKEINRRPGNERS